MKKHRSYERCFSASQNSSLCLELLEALGADVLTLEVDDILGVVAEDASRMILVKNDVVAFNEDLESILLGDVKSTAQLDGEHDAAEFIYFSYDTG